ncbi:MAG: hypothetical protein Q4C18_01435 [Eubacteriales bacterium]|nr:hypothetical protein [Eubacteriales bacterium]
MFDKPKIVSGKEYTAMMIGNVNVIVMVLSILIAHIYFQDNGNFAPLGILMYDFSNYLLTTFFKCRVPEKNRFTFRLRCIFCVITLISLIYMIIVVLFADGYVIWILPEFIIFLFSLVVLYNGYQAEKNANNQKEAQA